MTYPEISALSPEELDQYPYDSFAGKIHVIDRLNDVNKAVAYLSEHSLIGFDTETRPTFSKNHSNTVALLQLSTETHAYLFRLKKIGMPLSLSTLLSSPNITKIGVAVRDDIRALQKLRPFQANNFVDLQTIAKQLNIDAFGLRKLTPIALGFRISKRQQLSNWENERLTDPQKLYAATDAWVSLEIFKKLYPYTL